jgi:hypothetical protein
MMTKRKLSEAIRSIIFAFDSKDDRREVIRMLANKVEALEKELWDISSNYDCDLDAHKHGAPCFVCRSALVLENSKVSMEDLGLSLTYG